MNPFTISPTFVLGIAFAWSISIGATFYISLGVGRDLEIAAQSKADTARQETQDAAVRAIAEALPKIQFKNTTIRQTLETKTREVPYPVDCRLQPDVLRLLNSTPGVAAAAELPASGPAR